MVNNRKDKGSAILGDLEAAVMNVIWQRGEATVEEVRGSLERDRKPAYTTVMTVMSRLAEKGVLQRRKRGRAFLYRAVADQAEVAGSMLSNLVDRLYAGSPGRAIAHLIETEENVADGELARLEEMIRKRRTRGER